MDYVLGIDIGSTASKAVLLDKDGNIKGKAIEPLGTGTAGPQRVFDRILQENNIERGEIARTMATGYGRFSFPGADDQRSEISCHAKGVYFTDNTIRTIVDIGGQDVKVIKLSDQGQVMNFTMNDKCAAGTGRFLENMAKVLNLKTEELSDISQTAKEEAEISNTCTVFAESEVISKLANNVAIEDLVAGIHRSVAKRVAALAFRNGVMPKVAMSGGVALNRAIVKALSEEINSDVMVYENSQFFGAIGAALYALEKVKL